MKEYKKKKAITIVVIALLMFSMICLKDNIGVFRTTVIRGKIVIDAGHGGFDPGKVGIQGTLEKDINLKIALKLKEFLEAEHYQVVMTRDTDCGLYGENDSNKKRTDLSNRVKIINESNAFVAVSIHQNSFSQASSKGAQVFYYNTSGEGAKLANIMQETIKTTIGDGNHRVAKENESYYLLKKTNCPLVIIECGFLSNANEEAMLLTEEYQQKMAEAIKKGIMEYERQSGEQKVKIQIEAKKVLENIRCIRACLKIACHSSICKKVA